MLKRQQALQRNDLGAPLGREMICCGSALKILFHFARAILLLDHVILNSLAKT